MSVGDLFAGADDGNTVLAAALAAHRRTCAYLNVGVDYGVAYVGAAFYNGAAHNDRVAHFCAGHYLNAREQHGVFNAAVNFAALADDRVRDFCFIADVLRRKRAVARGEEYTLAPVRGGTQTSVSLAAGESFFYPVTAGEELLVSARLPEELTAPLAAGQAVGELIVSMDGEELARVPLVCAEPVAAAEKKQSLFERLFDRTG